MSNRWYYIQYFLIRIFRIFAIFLGLLLIIALLLFTYLDRTPVVETSAYQKTMAGIDTFKVELPIATSDDTLRIGWAKVNLTPDSPIELAGYGARKQKVYEVVHDSVFVRAFVFENGLGRNALVTLDMLIFPPEVVKALEGRLPEGLHLANTFFTATHSHSSIGHWQPGFVGELFAGEFDENRVEFITQRVISALQKALKNTEKGTIGYEKVNERQLIRNRLVKQKGTVDPWLRLIKMEKVTGEKALLFSYSAHATCLSYSYSELSGDYPNEVVRQLEADSTVEFAAYMAGAVGSMSPEAPGLRGFEKVDFVASRLKSTINERFDSIQTSVISSVLFNEFPFDPGKPQFKISESLKVRSWLFPPLFGKSPMELTSMRLGNILLIGVPCDFSGELVEPLEKIATENGMQLVIASFNGGYAGYVTKDEWYDLNKYETRTMNWYGPEIGKYFSEAIEKIILGYAAE